MGLLEGGRDTCLQIKGVTDDWSVEIWGKGGALDGPTCKRSMPEEKILKKRGSCARFEEAGVRHAETEGQPVTNIVDHVATWTESRVSHHENYHRFSYV